MTQEKVACEDHRHQLLQHHDIAVVSNDTTTEDTHNTTYKG
jgi:hypothetical protein